MSAFFPAGGTRWHAPRASRLLDRHPTRPAARCRTLCGLETIGTLVRGEKPTCRRCVRVLAGRVHKAVETLRRRSRALDTTP